MIGMYKEDAEDSTDTNQATLVLLFRKFTKFDTADIWIRTTAINASIRFKVPILYFILTQENLND